MIEICRIEEIPDGGARGFAVQGPGFAQRFFILRCGGAIKAYVNSCPHLWSRLDYERDQFMDEAGGFIRCDIHGALFRVEDGVCIDGPCLDERLVPAPVVERDGRLYYRRDGVALVDEISKLLSDFD